VELNYIHQRLLSFANPEGATKWVSHLRAEVLKVVFSDWGSFTLAKERLLHKGLSSLPPRRSLT
jgi:hypothetical protein